MPGSGIIGPAVYGWISRDRYALNFSRACKVNVCFNNMMCKNISYLFLTVVALFCLSGRGMAQEITELSAFSGDDRVLILAPHPDDEAICCAGVIQRALKIGAKVKVAYLTNGDHNELAFIVYEKRLTFRKGEFIHMGEIRIREAKAAMSALGLGKDDLIFLGYPDYGMLEILLKYWGKVKPFKVFLTRISRVPYPECLSPNSPYNGENVLRDLENVLLEFRPNKIFVSHPVDVNRDHRSLYVFLRLALWDISSRITEPKIYPYLIHVVGWPSPRGFHPDLRLLPPEKIKYANISWRTLELTPKEINRKNKITSFYKSQIEYNPPYLFTFDRQNELFGDYPVIRLKGGKEAVWQDVNVPEAPESDKYAAQISNLAYALTDNFIFIKLTLSRDKHFKGSVLLFGYKKGINFGLMPKIRLTVGAGGMHIKDKKQPIFVKDALLKYEDRALILKIPLSLLGNPDYLVSSVLINSKGMDFDDTAWRVIELG